MKYLKRFNENVEEGSLKDRLTYFYGENEANYDPEETVNVMEILDEYDDNLTGLKHWDKVILLRILDDEDLVKEVEAAGESGTSRRNIFDSGNPFD